MTKTLDNPDYELSLDQLDNPATVLKVFKNLDCANYSYSFEHPAGTIKIGRSCAKTPGERLYRQIGHLPGWDRKPESPSGNDIEIAVDLFEKAHGVKVDRRDCVVKVWDVTGTASPSVADPELPSRIAENDLLTEYEQITGALPPGNRKDTRTEMIKPYVSRDLFDNLFEQQTAQCKP